MTKRQSYIISQVELLFGSVVKAGAQILEGAITPEEHATLVADFVAKTAHLDFTRDEAARAMAAAGYAPQAAQLLQYFFSKVDEMSAVKTDSS